MHKYICTQAKKHSHLEFTHKSTHTPTTTIVHKPVLINRGVVERPNPKSMQGHAPVEELAMQSYVEDIYSSLLKDKYFFM